MSLYRKNLPQLDDAMFITDAGLETMLVFQDNYDLPEFAAYDLLRTEQGYEKLFNYYKSFIELANKHQKGIVLETPTWRASRDWGIKIGDSPEEIIRFNRESVKMVEHARNEYSVLDIPVVISGSVGPRGDGYCPDIFMSIQEAKDYHLEQINIFSETSVDMVCALTLNYTEEAVGITQAAKEANLPVCISFTVEQDGKLPSGETLEDAIKVVDKKAQGGPTYYMINCAHPEHFYDVLEDGLWIKRLHGVRANASKCSHAELDDAEELDDGDPVELGQHIAQLRKRFPHMNVFGGCCGTDHRHVEQMLFACS